MGRAKNLCRFGTALAGGSGQWFEPWWEQLNWSALICRDEGTQFFNTECGSFSGLKKAGRGPAIVSGWRGCVQLEEETGNREQSSRWLSEMVTSSLVAVCTTLCSSDLCGIETSHCSKLLRGC